MILKRRYIVDVGLPAILAELVLQLEVAARQNNSSMGMLYLSDKSDSVYQRALFELDNLYGPDWRADAIVRKLNNDSS